MSVDVYLNPVLEDSMETIVLQPYTCYTNFKPKLIVLQFLTLDSVVQAPGGPDEDTSGRFEYGGWTAPYFDDFAGKIMTEQMKQPFSLLLGRKTFDIFSGYWHEHADMWPGINTSTKYVASKTLSTSDWENCVFLQDDVTTEIKKLKAGAGPNIQVHGSANLIQTLLKNDLVDELWLKIFPLTLGKGKKLFDDGTVPAAFILTQTQISPTGVIFANFTRSGDVKPGAMV